MPSSKVVGVNGLAAPRLITPLHTKQQGSTTETISSRVLRPPSSDLTFVGTNNCNWPSTHQHNAYGAFDETSDSNTWSLVVADGDTLGG